MSKSDPALGPTFLLVGNGPYRNRGCEAIVRGTMAILRAEFGPEVRARAGVFASPALVSKQNAEEQDPSVSSFPLLDLSGPRWSVGWWREQVSRRLRKSPKPHLRALLENAGAACAALQIGGDNYTLDYGVPHRFTEVDRLLQSHHLPVCLWGASVGPFDAAPEFAPRMFEHLRELRAVLVRENHSLEYLRSKGVAGNVHLVADPAFLLPAVEPPAEKLGFSVPQDAIGINFSPLMARFRGTGSPDARMSAWLNTCVELIERIGRDLERPLLLVPHVGSSAPIGDDFSFLENVCQAARPPGRVPVHVLPRGLHAAEIKWLISRCSAFAGARTHSTIAAMSSHVPTVTIGYSLKADGINWDIYGHHDFRIPIADLNPGIFTAKLKSVLQNRSGIRAFLEERIPEFRARALSAGPLLRQLLRQSKPAVGICELAPAAGAR